MPNYKIMCILKFWSIYTARKGYKRECVKKEEKKKTQHKNMI